MAAFTETFLTWGILGACTMQITSHNRPKHLLHRDASLVVILTIAVLVLSAFLANTCVQLLEAHGYVYLPSSFGEFDRRATEPTTRRLSTGSPLGTRHPRRSPTRVADRFTKNAARRRTDETSASLYSTAERKRDFIKPDTIGRTTVVRILNVGILCGF